MYNIRLVNKQYTQTYYANFTLNKFFFKNHRANHVWLFIDFCKLLIGIILNERVKLLLKLIKYGNKL